jgi:hypothetical protein
MTRCRYRPGAPASAGPGRLVLLALGCTPGRCCATANRCSAAAMQMVAVYPHRSGVPRAMWKRLLSAAEREVGVPALAKLLRAHLTTFNRRPGKSGLPGRPGPPVGLHQLPAIVGPGTPGCPDRGGIPLATGPSALRPAPRMPVHLSQRGSSRHPGSRMGRPQRRDAAPRLRQMPRRPGRDREAQDHRCPG